MFARTALAVALLATTTLAQIPGLPDCAQTCISNYGGCNQIDVKCICSNKPLLATLSCCVSQKCDAAGQAAVISFADNLCRGFQVTDLPTAATCAPGTESTGSASSATSTGTMSMTSAASSSGTAAAAASSSASSSASEASTSAASSSAAAATTSSAAAGKMAGYPVEGMGLGMAILGLVVGL